MVDTIRDGDIARYADFDNGSLGWRMKVERQALDRLPLIDIAPFVAGGSAADRARVAAEIRAACIDIGFFYVTGHGIPAAELEEVTARGMEFFERPLEEKLRIHHTRSRSGEGFMTPGGLDAASNPDKAADLRERFVFNGEAAADEPPAHLPRMGGAQWPGENVLPGFERFIKAHVQKRKALARQLVRAFASSLALPEDWFDAMYRRLRGNFLYNYYPPIDPATVKPNQWSFSPHTDYGAFTILSQDAVGGLQARNVAGEWIDVPPIAGTFVVNIGDTFQMWTNDLYVSTLHRAANVNDRARLSAVLFTAPRGDTLIECLPTCQGPDNPPKYAPVVSEDYSRTLVEQSRRTGRPGVSTRTADRLIIKGE
jgi:isopenicillin N synthase-like dioxygenase